MEIATFETEKNITKNKSFLIAGIDEAGRGPLAGPVVSAAVIFKHDFDKDLGEDFNGDIIRDSKTLSEKQRNEAFDLVKENFYVGVGICNHETIDRVNILQASFLSMKKAVLELRKEMKNIENRKFLVLLDGNQKIPNFSEEQFTIPQGDKKVKSISAASIIAKVTRDRMMLEYGEKYPEYSFERHKGYGTKAHMEALLKSGPCEIHRKSFKPIKKLLKKK